MAANWELFPRFGEYECLCVEARGSKGNGPKSRKRAKGSSDSTKKHLWWFVALASLVITEANSYAAVAPAPHIVKVNELHASVSERRGHCTARFVYDAESAGDQRHACAGRLGARRRLRGGGLERVADVLGRRQEIFGPARR